MIYKWKIDGLYDISAKSAGGELTRIYQKYGKMDPPDVVSESRPDDAVLHPCFEWDDPKAAELWREQQARNLICCLVTVEESKHKEPKEVRAFVHVSDSYRPISIVMREPDMREELLQRFLKDAETFERRFQAVSDLAYPITEAIERVRPKVQEELDLIRKRNQGVDHGSTNESVSNSPR